MRIPVYSIVQVARRAALVWAVEVLALETTATVLPGLYLHGPWAAAFAVATIGLLNALVRPVLVFLTLPFTVLSFGFLTLVLNALILLSASLIVPGFAVDNLLVAAVAAFALAAANTIFSRALSLSDEGSFYRNILRHFARRVHAEGAPTSPGVVFLEIDGLSRPVLDEAVRRGYMPTLANWIARGSHRVVSWDCGLPSQTSSSQAGILHGNMFDIPAFRWYDKSTKKVRVSNHPRDAHDIEQHASDGHGLLVNGGLSVSNLLSGDADITVATMSTYSRRSTKDASSAYFGYVVNPYNFSRALVLMAWEVLVEWRQSIAQKLRGVTPRVSRAGWFPFLRAAATVFQRDLTVNVLVGQLFAGVPAAYATLLGYDVVSHHAGTRSRDALGVLRDIDARVRALRRAANDAPRPYHFVVLSDHGHSPSVPFVQMYGKPFETVVHELLAQGHAHAAGGPAEGWGHVNALLTAAISYESRTGRAARRVLRRRTHDGYVDLTPAIQGATAPVPATEEDVVVCASGNLGMIYFARDAGRVDFERLAASHPRLIEGLVAHPGIGFVMAQSREYGALVVGRGGVRYLETGKVDGTDPLLDYGEHAAGHLRTLSGYPQCADLVTNGRFDPDTGTVVTFEDQVGAHGGLGGDQTEPFVLFPAHWPISKDLRSPLDIHRAFCSWRERLARDMH